MTGRLFSTGALFFDTFFWANKRKYELNPHLIPNPPRADRLPAAGMGMAVFFEVPHRRNYVTAYNCVPKHSLGTRKEVEKSPCIRFPAFQGRG